MSPVVARTVLLLHCEGVEGSTSFSDASGLSTPLSATGTVKITTAQSKLGSSSAVFDGSASWVEATPTAKLAANTSRPYTFEFFARYTGSASATKGMVCLAEPYGVRCIWNGPTQSMGLYDSYSGLTLTNPTAQSTGVWYHYAFVKDLTECRLYIDGVKVATVTGAKEIYPRSTVYIGKTENGDYFTGNVDEVRITDGLALYNDNFTPPMAPLTAQVMEGASVFLDDKVAYGQMFGSLLQPLPAFDLSSSTKVLRDLEADVLPLGFPADARARQILRLNSLSDASLERFVDDIGYGQIVGTIKEKSLPVNIPRVCKVFLYRHPNNQLVRVTLSNPDGSYTFRGINPDYRYMALATDPTGIYRAVVADNLTPDVIPQPA